jgi:uncharacterized spore protein YtfJ
MSLNNTIESLLKTMQDTIKTETVVGEPIKIDTKTIIPISSLKFGFGHNNSNIEKAKKESSFSAGGAKVDPVAFLVIDKESVELVPLKFKDSIFDKLIDAKNYEKIAKFVDKLKKNNNNKTNLDNDENSKINE